MSPKFRQANIAVDVPEGVNIYRCRGADAAGNHGGPDESRWQKVRYAFKVAVAWTYVSHPEWVFWEQWGRTMCARRDRLIIADRVHTDR